MTDPLLQLMAKLHAVVNFDEEKCRKINEILNSRIEIYSQCISTSLEELSFHKYPDAIQNWQNKKSAYKMGEALLNNGHLKIEVCNPEDYRDIMSGKLPDWTSWEERRIAKLWVLK